MSEQINVHVDATIRTIWFKLSRMYNQKAAEHDMTMSIGFILMNIDKEGTPSTQLGPKMGMEPTSLSRTLKTMEQKKLIYRKTENQDKRKVLIFLTEEGVKKRREIRNFLIDFNSKILYKIPKTKLNNFLEIIQKIDFEIDKEIKIK